MEDKNKSADRWIEERAKVESTLEEVATRMGEREGRKKIETRSNDEVLMLEVMRLRSAEGEMCRELAEQNQWRRIALGALVLILAVLGLLTFSRSYIGIDEGGAVYEKHVIFWIVPVSDRYLEYRVPTGPGEIEWEAWCYQDEDDGLWYEAFHPPADADDVDR